VIADPHRDEEERALLAKHEQEKLVLHVAAGWSSSAATAG
jgi:hypothetical protein